MVIYGYMSMPHWFFKKKSWFWPYDSAGYLLIKWKNSEKMLISNDFFENCKNCEKNVIINDFIYNIKTSKISVFEQYNIFL